MMDDGRKYRKLRKYTLMDDGWWMIEESTESTESSESTESKETIHWWMMVESTESKTTRPKPPNLAKLHVKIINLAIFKHFKI